MGNFTSSPLVGRSIDWYNSNSYRSFPFKEDSLFDLKNSIYTFPLNILLDLTIIDTRNRISDYDLQPSLKLVKISSDEAEPAMVFIYSTSKDEAIELLVPLKITKSNTTDIYVGKVKYNIENDIPLYIKFATTSITLDTLDQIKGATLNHTPEILDSRIIMSKVSGVNSIIGTDSSVASGEVYIKQGCNTDVFIKDNQIHVRLRRGAGAGTCCRRDNPDSESIGINYTGCDEAFLFLNGQTADINGNIPLIGGSGVIVRPANTSDYYRGIPTIDVLSTPELLNIIGD